MKQGRKVSAIAVGLALSGLTSLSPAYAQQADEEAASLERIAVTGSRIKRTDMEGPSPPCVRIVVASVFHSIRQGAEVRHE